MLAPLNDRGQRTAVTAERACLAVLDGSCRTPIAALAEPKSAGATFRLRALIALPDGSKVHDCDWLGSAENPQALGKAVGAALKGAADRIFLQGDDSMTLRALITRPEEDAAPLAAALIQRGIETSIESLLSIRTLPEAEIDLSGVQAMLFTSANGVRAFAELAAAKGLAGWRELPVLAVGDATARTAPGRRLYGSGKRRRQCEIAGGTGGCETRSAERPAVPRRGQRRGRRSRRHVERTRLRTPPQHDL